MDVLYHNFGTEKSVKKHPAIAGYFYFILHHHQEQQKLFYDRSNRA